MTATAARATDRRFAVRLAVVVVGGFLLRLAYLWFSRKGACDFALPQARPEGCAGDSYVYHYGADLLARGKGFIVPTDYIVSGGTVVKDGADHPPLYTLILAGFSLLGMGSWLWHELVSVLIGTGTVLAVGVAGRRIAGDRVGLVAAGLAAVLPSIWVNDAVVLSEGLTILNVALIAWLAYRFRDAPSYRAVAWLSLACAAATLTRAEAALFFPALVLPLALVATSLPWRDRLLRVGVAAAVALAAMAPWVGYNLSRFNNPVTLSTGFGITLANSNCDGTYYGDGVGFWSFPCIGPLPWTQTTEELLAYDPATLRRLAEWSGVEVGDDPPVDELVLRIQAKAATADQSDDELFLRRKGRQYIADHTGRVPVVVLARLGRVWNLYRPLQVTRLDVGEGRPLWVNRLGLVAYYPTMALAAAGVVVLRRRRTLVFPLLVPLGIVCVATAITFGQTRYRTTAEAAIALLAAVGVVALADRVRARGTPAPGQSHAPTGSDV